MSAAHGKLASRREERPMNPPELELLDPATAQTLGATILARAEALCFAAQVAPFVNSDAPGTYTLLPARRVPRHLNAQRLTLQVDGGKRVVYLLVREPVSCFWMAIGSDSEIGLSSDVYDFLWLSRPFSTYPTRDALMEVLLLHHGYLAPWIDAPRIAVTARLRLQRSWRDWRRAFLNADDFATDVCPGCELCNGAVFHRVERELP